ncbi:MAG: Mut7-C RNAse domain-containing protein [Planctomycetota bacterium]
MSDDTKRADKDPERSAGRQDSPAAPLPRQRPARTPFPAFACDAMLKGLARWLRAFGYDATWRYGIEDGELVAHSLEERRVLLTSDSGLMRRRAIREGHPAALFIPRDLSVDEQLRFVAGTFELRRRRPRCMRCGGALRRVPKESVRDEAPPKTFLWLDEFYRCGRCGGLFWKGTHWQRIARTVGRCLDRPGRAHRDPGRDLG